MTTLTRTAAADAANEARKAAEFATEAASLVDTIRPEWRTPGGASAVSLADWIADNAREAAESARCALDSEQDGDHHDAEDMARQAYDLTTTALDLLDLLRDATRA